MVCKYWKGTTHVDLGGNVKFIHEDSVECIEKILKEIIDIPDKYQKMKNVAEKIGMETFSYNRISERAIGR